MTDFHYRSAKSDEHTKPRYKTTSKCCREKERERERETKRSRKFHLNAFIHPCCWQRSPMGPNTQMHVTFVVNMFILIYSSLSLSLSLSLSHQISFAMQSGISYQKGDAQDIFYLTACCVALEFYSKRSEH